MPLSGTSVKTARPTEKPYKKSDGGGLYLLVQPTGGRLWRLDYRFLGKRKTLAFGSYPAVGLADARSKREEAKKLLANDVDPGQQKKSEQAFAKKAEGETFGVIAKQVIERLENDGASFRTIEKNRWLLEGLASPLSKRPIAKITAGEILELLQAIELSGRLESAKRLRSSISRVFRLAVVTLRAPTDPTYALIGATKRPKAKSFAAIVDERRLGWLLRTIDGYDGWPTIRWALQFAALTAARPGEVRNAGWDEIDWSQRTWKISAHRHKSRMEHHIPLSAQSVVLLKEVQRLSGHGRLIFPSIRSNDRPISENAMNSALARAGVMPSEHVPHGFRSSFSTILNERAKDAEIIEICLAHVGTDKVRRIYNRAVRWSERTAMMDLWANLLDEFRELKPTKD